MQYIDVGVKQLILPKPVDLESTFHKHEGSAAVFGTNAVIATMPTRICAAVALTGSTPDSVELTIAWLVRYHGCRQARRVRQAAGQCQLFQACAVRNVLLWLSRLDRGLARTPAADTLAQLELIEYA